MVSAGRLADGHADSATAFEALDWVVSRATTFEVAERAVRAAPT